MHLNSVLPFSVPIIPYQQKCPDPVGDAWITPQARLHRARLYRSFQDIPVLFFESLPRTCSDLFPQYGRFTRVGVSKVNSGIFSLEKWCVENVSTSMFDRWKRWGLSSDFPENVKVLGHLDRARLFSTIERIQQTESGERTSEATAREASMRACTIGNEVPRRRAVLRSVMTRS